MDQLPPSRLPLHSIFLSLDLGLSILDYLSWGALVRLSNACRGFRSLTRGYMKRQVTNYLVKFIPDGKVDNLLEHLKRAGGCIVGGVPDVLWRIRVCGNSITATLPCCLI